MSRITNTPKLGLNRRLLCALGLAICLTPAATINAAVAGNLSEPRGDVVLTIEGEVGNPNVAGRVDLDLSQIEALPKVTFSTTTPWTKGRTTFEGVLLKDLLQVAGAQGTTLKAVALNDYSSEIPAIDAQNHRVIVAYKTDGEYMPVRSKGPLWIVYPFDDDPVLKSEKIYSRAVWQLRKITVIN